MNCQFMKVRSLQEALLALKDATPQSRILAGGTDLMVEFAGFRTQPDRVIDIWSVDDLRGIYSEGDGTRIGALTTCRELTRSLLIQEKVPLLIQAAREVGAAQIQARATLGGNLGTASPAADISPALMVLRATLRLASLDGLREIPIDEFFVDTRKTRRRDDELIESIFIPTSSRELRTAYRKVGTRRAQSISKVVVAAAALYDGDILQSLRVAAGSVAPKTVLMTTMDRLLKGSVPTRKTIEDAVSTSVRNDVSPIDDVRSTALYRRRALHRILLTLTLNMTGVS